jgi:hypothetical protein
MLCLQEFRLCVGLNLHLRGLKSNLGIDLYFIVEVAADIFTSSFIIVIAKAINNLRFFFIYVLCALFLITL